VTSPAFAVTWDYRCPYARNAHEHLLAGLAAGASWDVRFVPFSLDQTHVEDGDAPVWERPGEFPGLLATAAGMVLRDRFPEHFLAAHGALFSARHDRALDLRRRDVLAGVLAGAGVDAAAVLAEIDDGWPYESFRKEHEAAAQLEVFGVPTFMTNDHAVFVRLLDRPLGDADLAVRTIDRIVDLIDEWPMLNELKHTTVPR